MRVMTLFTDRYSIRPFVQADRPFVFQGLSDPQVILHYGVSYDSLEGTQVQMDWFEQIERTNTGRWRAIADREGTRLYGAVGFNNWNQVHRKAELGFWLLPAYWKTGVMSEVLPRMLEFGFDEMRLHRIEAEVETENEASRNILRRHHFRHEGTKHECELKNNRFINLEIYALLSTVRPSG